VTACLHVPSLKRLYTPCQPASVVSCLRELPTEVRILNGESRAPLRFKSPVLARYLRRLRGVRCTYLAPSTPPANRPHQHFAPP
jgi:hypothetical protein